MALKRLGRIHKSLNCKMFQVWWGAKSTSRTRTSSRSTSPPDVAAAFTPGSKAGTPRAKPAPPAPPEPAPRRLADLIGQSRVVANLSLAVRRARKKKRALGHVHLTGASGLGKTTLAHALAGEMGRRTRVVQGPQVKEACEILSPLLDLEPGDVLFVDEIHALKRAVVESLYEALAEGRMTVPVRSRGRVRNLAFELPPFTLVAATTEPEELPDALESRFSIRETLSHYKEEELAEIVKRSARREGCRIKEDAAALVLARASRGLPSGAGGDPAHAARDPGRGRRARRAVRRRQRPSGARVFGDRRAEARGGRSARPRRARGVAGAGVARDALGDDGDRDGDDPEEARADPHPAGARRGDSVRAGGDNAADTRPDSVTNMERRQPATTSSPRPSVPGSAFRVRRRNRRGPPA